MSNLNQLQFQFSRNVCQLIQFANTQGYEITIGEVLRTQEQQKIYLKEGKSKTLNSYHLKKLAIDIHLFKNGKYLTANNDYAILAKHWEQLHSNNVAGYYWGWDANHFEMRELKRTERL